MIQTRPSGLACVKSAFGEKGAVNMKNALAAIILLALTLFAAGIGCRPPQYPPPPPPPGGNMEQIAAALADADVAWPLGGTGWGYPDKFETYWGDAYRLNMGDKLIVKGKFPYARYMSLTTYGVSGNTEPTADTIYDTLISPDPGASDRYTITIDPGAKPGAGNNMLAPFPDGFTGNIGLLGYRLYLPDDPKYDPVEGWADILPELTYVYADGSRRQLTKVVPRPAEESTAAAVPRIPDGPLGFYRFSFAGGLENVQNAYLATTASWQKGRILVITGKAPTFPDTRRGESKKKPSQLRYWSLTTYRNQVPYPAVGGAADFETVLDDRGYYTYVMSDPADKPKNAVPENGVTWIPWGDALLFRNMLPAEDFAQAAQNIGPGDDAATVMGEYYPRAYYSTSAEFESK